MKYPCYCKACDKITGHTTSGLKSSCDICGRTGTAPYIRWALLPIIVFVLAAIPIYIIVTSPFVQLVLIACIAFVVLLVAYGWFRNSRYAILLADLVRKCTSAFNKAKSVLKMQ
jgi:hypothetical protein